MKNLKTLGLLCAIFLFINCANQEKDTKKIAIADKPIEAVIELPQAKSLYERLGGTEGISSIVDSITANHLSNPVINEKFSHLKPGTKAYELFKTHVKQFLEAGTGGTEIGRAHV